MTMPVGAVFEAELAGGIALYDVSHMLPRHPHKIYARRDPARIERLYVHHSGMLSDRHGYRGCVASARYCVTHRGWPGHPYTYWLTHHPDRDPQGRIVVYRCQPDSARSYHSGGRANGHGISVALQGDLSWKDPTPAQIEHLEALIPWLVERHPLLVLPNGLSMHNEAGFYGGRSKASCPGPYMTRWISEYRMAT